MDTIEFHIPANEVEAYSEYCPLVSMTGTKDGDEFVAYDQDNQEIRFSSADVVEKPGFLIIQLGDARERDHTVEAAAFAIFQSLNSLFAACAGDVHFERIRTSVELSEFMKRYRFNYSHVVLVGHGDQNGGIPFMDQSEPLKGHSLAGLLGADGSVRDIELISLCCHTGCESLSSALSNAVGVKHVIAPQKAFDLRWAVHFVTGYFLERYLSGKPIDQAVCDASVNPTATPMSVWKQGRKIYNCA